LGEDAKTYYDQKYRYANPEYRTVSAEIRAFSSVDCGFFEDAIVGGTRKPHRDLGSGR
jgi:hypothetical protein